MGALAPALVLCLLAVLFNHAGRSWRSAWLAAAVTWGVWLVALTEALSPFRLMTAPALLAGWGIALLLLAGVAWRWGVRPTTVRARLPRPRIDRASAVLIFGIAFIAAVTAVIAWIAPPNTWDSMTYHMARVAHWVQNRSVADYPTNIDRQLWLNPGAEFVILHLQILWGGDRLANFVQWAAMVGSMIGVSLLAQQVGAAWRGQLFAAVFAATIPMGILQASSTQNDYVLGFWLVCAVVFMAKLGLGGGQSFWSDAFLAAGALGMAVLTKGTAYLFIPPLAIWGVGWWARKRWRQPRFGLHLMALILILTTGSLLLSAGHYSRNFQLYGNPLGQEDKGTYRVGVFGVGTTVSNMMRTGSQETQLPWPRADIAMYHAVRWAHAVLGLNPDDPRTIYANKFITDFRIQEDLASSPAHAFLILLAFLLWPLARSLRSNKPTWTLALAIAGGGLLFCAYLRWEPWGARYLLPLLVLSAAPLGVAAGKLPRLIAIALALVLLALALPPLLCNESRPLVGHGAWNILICLREKQYFTNRPNLFATNFDLAGKVRKMGLERVGLILGPDDYEYPFWMLVHKDNPRPVRMEQVRITNASKIFLRDPYFRDFQPQVIVDMRPH